MTFAPVAPTIAVPPVRIAADTYVIRQVQPALGAVSPSLAMVDHDKYGRSVDSCRI
jgi:hypothetical protein